MLPDPVEYGAEVLAGLVGRAAGVLSLKLDGLIQTQSRNSRMFFRRSCSTGIPPPHRSHFLRVERYSLRVARDRALVRK